jgi:hypothetical protein
LLRKAADVDDDGQPAFHGESTEAVANAPRGLFIKRGKNQSALLEGDAGEIGLAVQADALRANVCCTCFRFRGHGVPELS